MQRGVRVAVALALFFLFRPGAQAQPSFSEEYLEWHETFTTLVSLALTVPIGASLASYGQRRLLEVSNAPEERANVRALAERAASTIDGVVAAASATTRHLDTIRPWLERDSAMMQSAALSSFIERVGAEREVLQRIGDQTPFKMTPVAEVERTANEIQSAAADFIRNVAVARLSIAGDETPESVLQALRRDEANTAGALFRFVLRADDAAVRGFRTPKAVFDSHMAKASLIFNVAGANLQTYMDTVSNEPEAAQHLSRLVEARQAIANAPGDPLELQAAWTSAVKDWFEFVIARSSLRKGRLSAISQ